MTYGVKISRTPDWVKITALLMLPEQKMSFLICGRQGPNSTTYSDFIKILENIRFFAQMIATFLGMITLLNSILADLDIIFERL